MHTHVSKRARLGVEAATVGVEFEDVDGAHEDKADVVSAELDVDVAHDEEDEEDASNRKEEKGHAELGVNVDGAQDEDCLLYTSPSPRDGLLSRMPSSA